MNTPSQNCLRLLMAVAFCATFLLVPFTRAADGGEPQVGSIGGVVPFTPAADGDIGSNVATIAVSSKLTLADVETAVQQALIARKWVVRDKSAGRIVAHYERGKNAATLTLRYDSAKIEIYAVGQSRRGGLPMSWIENLKSDINVYLGRALLSK